MTKAHNNITKSKTKTTSRDQCVLTHIIWRPELNDDRTFKTNLKQMKSFICLPHNECQWRFHVSNGGKCKSICYYSAYWNAACVITAAWLDLRPIWQYWSTKTRPKECESGMLITICSVASASMRWNKPDVNDGLCLKQSRRLERSSVRPERSTATLHLQGAAHGHAMPCRSWQRVQYLPFCFAE